VTAPKRRAAKRPAPRIVEVSIAEGDFAGWSATARADFPAAILAELQSSDIARISAALGRIIIEHNMPDSEDNIAATLAEVDPYEGMMAISSAIFDAIGNLPNR